MVSYEQMDDTAQPQVQDQQNVNPGQQNISPTSFGGISKEREVGAVSDYLQPTESEPEIEQEVKDAGVEKVSENLNLENVSDLEHTKNFTPVKTEPGGIVQFQDDNKVMQYSKESAANSAKWWAQLVIKIRKRLNIK